MIRNICHVAILLHVLIVNGQNLTNVKILYQNLFSDYTKEVMPMLDHSKPLDLGIAFYLVSMNYFREVDESMSLIGVLSLTWFDPSLTWDPSAYGNLQRTIIDPKDMWKPSLFLINRVDTMKPVGHDITFPATIDCTGQVYYQPGGVLDAKCSTDIAKFPFDTQECTLEVMPWGIPSTHLKISALFADAQLDWFTKHSDWTFLEYSTSAGNKSDYTLFFFKLKIKREPLYYGTIMILPTVLFAILNPLVFMLPVESGERISFAMTILLSYAIFLTLVTASIPASSNPMCVLLVIMIVIIAISGTIMAGAIVSANYYYRKDVGGTCILALTRFARWKPTKQVGVISCVDKDDKDKNADVSGKDISNAIDSLIFYGSYVGVVLTTVTYFIYVLV